MNILSHSITPSDTIRNLDVTFDNGFNFRKHVSLTCPSCFYNIRELRRIRRYISLSVAKTIATALITSRLDYSFCNIASRDIIKLQCVQNCLAKDLTRPPRFSHPVPLLKSLHWLPVQSRIIFKLCTIAYQTLSSGEPLHLFSRLSLEPSQENSLHLVFTCFVFLGLKHMLGFVLFQLLSLLFGIHYLNTLSHQIA